MDRLENYIQQNKVSFYEKELTEGHEMRFAAKLQQGGKVQPFWRKQMLRVAVVALLCFGSVTLFKVLDNAIQNKQMAKLPVELQEVESFYLVKCEKELTHFRTYNSENSPVDIAKELEVLGKEYQKLKEEMVKQSGNERIMVALVENLKLRLQLLQEINRLMKKEESQIITI